MAINITDIYGTVSDAEDYFAVRLHEQAWSDASPSDKSAALLRATKIIDRLNFKGYKSTVYSLLQSTDCPAQTDINSANAAQALEFPRDTDSTVPEEIELACYEIAYALLDGIDPELELENLSVSSQGYASARTTYDRGRNPLEHLNAGIPSAYAWSFLKPFLRDAGGIKLSRV
jgi:hypothetical protein